MRNSLWAAAIWVLSLAATAGANAPAWTGYAGNPQHTAQSSTASQPLDSIHWQTPVDLSPQFSGTDLLIHYGSPMITAANTVIVPVKTGSSGGFEVEGLNSNDGSVKWVQTSDYTLPPMGQSASYYWTPSYSPTIACGNTLYYPGAGGTVYKRSSLDANGAVTPTQEAFYGSLATYSANMAAYNTSVAISTPITAAPNGDIYFGYQTSNSAPGGMTNGIARISASGQGSFFPASQLLVNGSPAGMKQVVTNCAPAISKDGSTVYVAMSTGDYSPGRLVALNSTTLAPTASVALVDPKTGGNALLLNDGTASPMIGPDGDVYMGVYDDYGTSRGWMEHFSANLSVTKPAGGFGWDDTASVVPASMIPSYHGSSSYLIMTKYNNYADPGTGGDGKNMIAILDPNATQTDTRYNTKGAGGATIMKVVESVLGPTPDANFDGTHPGAVHEWCINTAAVDPATDSVLVNSEDGNLYRWNLAANTLTETINITSGLGEAYTPTEVGPDGTVYAINNATLFAVGVPGPASVIWNQVGGTWNTMSGNQPWLNGATPSAFTTGDAANFTDAAVGSVAIDAGGVSPGTTNVSNSSGTYTFTGGQILGGALTKSGAGTLVLDNPGANSGNTFTAVTISGGTVAIAPGAVVNALGTSTHVNSLTITGTGTLDLGNSKLTINYAAGPGGSPDAAIAALILQGRNGGTWDGTGITSSSVAADPTHLEVLWADGSNNTISVAGVTAGNELIEVSQMGDANGDGTVDGSDFVILAANFGLATTLGPAAGDFTYDGTVDGSDFVALASNFGLGTPFTAAQINAFNSLASQIGESKAWIASADSKFVVVPEPASLSLLALGSFGLLARCRIRLGRCH